MGALDHGSFLENDAEALLSDQSGGDVASRIQSHRLNERKEIIRGSQRLGVGRPAKVIAPLFRQRLRGQGA